MDKITFECGCKIESGWLAIDVAHDVTNWCVPHSKQVTELMKVRKPTYTNWFAEQLLRIINQEKKGGVNEQY